jgi:hypothetical protein
MKKNPLLTDATGMGGVNASDGFDYQVWNAMERLPAWIKHPGFEALILEGFEDFEVRFHSPYAIQGSILERFQAKSGELTKKDLKSIFSSFKAFSDRHPEVVRVDTLITPSLPSKIKWLQRDSDRIRKARPFYSPFKTVLSDTNQEYERNVNDEFGPEIGKFCIESVGIDLSTLRTSYEAEIAFMSSLSRAFPNLNLGHAQMKSAFDALFTHLSQNRGSLISREHLINLLSVKLTQNLFSDSALLIQIASNREHSSVNAIEFDSTPFDGSNGTFPENTVWHDLLVNPLQKTALWAYQKKLRKVCLAGSYRLTTAFILGWSFRSSTGFELVIPTKQEHWLTNDFPDSHTAAPWQFQSATKLSNNKLVVCIGVIRDPSSDIITLNICDFDAIQKAWLPEPITSAKQAQLSTSKVKASISEAVSRFNPSSIDLYYAGPAAFAVSLGHRWNGMPPTQLFEFNSSTRFYCKTAIIG